MLGSPNDGARISRIHRLIPLAKKFDKLVLAEMRAARAALFVLTGLGPARGQAALL